MMSLRAMMKIVYQNKMKNDSWIYSEGSDNNKPTLLMYVYIEISTN
ncbi:hypothetical protein BH18THE2_BH18THE2_25530 [soil metagenome]